MSYADTEATQLHIDEISQAVSKGGRLRPRADAVMVQHEFPSL